MRPRNKQVNRWWNPQGQSTRQCAVRQAQLHLGSPTCISEEGVLTDMETQPYSCYGIGKPALFPECLQQVLRPWRATKATIPRQRASEWPMGHEGQRS